MVNNNWTGRDWTGFACFACFRTICQALIFHFENSTFKVGAHLLTLVTCDLWHFHTSQSFHH